MNFEELIVDRFSARKFLSKKVEKEKIDKILEAARVAPTAKNIQPEQIFVLLSDEALEKFKKCTICHFDAPLAFLVCYDKNKSCKSVFDGREFGDIDASIAMTQ